MSVERKRRKGKKKHAGEDIPLFGISAQGTSPADQKEEVGEQQLPYLLGIPSQDTAHINRELRRGYTIVGGKKV